MTPFLSVSGSINYMPQGQNPFVINSKDGKRDGLTTPEPKFKYIGVNGFWVGLSAFGNPLVTCDGSSFTDLNSTLQNAISHLFVERLKHRFSESTPDNYEFFIVRIKDHIVKLMEAQTAFNQACSEYRQGFLYSRVFVQAHKNKLESQWHETANKFQGAIGYLQSQTANITIVRNVRDEVERVDSLFNQNWRAKTHDGEIIATLRHRLARIKYFVNEQSKETNILTVNDKICLSDWVTLRSRNLELQEHEYEKQLRREQYKSELGYYHIERINNPLPSLIAILKHFSSHNNNDGVLDLEQFKNTTLALTSFIVANRPTVMRWQQFLQNYQERLSLLAENDFEEKNYVQSLCNTLRKAEMAYITLQMLYLLSDCGFPVFLDLLQKPFQYPNKYSATLEGLDSVDACIDRQYLGLTASAQKYLKQLRPIHEDPLRNLKEEAARRILEHAQANLQKVAPNYRAIVANHEQRRLRAIQDICSRVAPDLFLIVDGYRLAIHRAVLKRINKEEPRSYFECLFSESWTKHEINEITLPETFSRPAVIELISCLYGLSNIEDVPDFLQPRFLEVYRYCIDAGV